MADFLQTFLDICSTLNIWKSLRACPQSRHRREWLQFQMDKVELRSYPNKMNFKLEGRAILGIILAMSNKLTVP
jgi:hypothetical protein